MESNFHVFGLYWRRLRLQVRLKPTHAGTCNSDSMSFLQVKIVDCFHVTTQKRNRDLSNLFESSALGILYRSSFFLYDCINCATLKQVLKNLKDLDVF